MKYLLALLVLLLVLSQLWRRLFAGLQKMAGVAGNNSGRADVQAMVPCYACAVHVPQNEAFYRAGRAYCSAAHAYPGRQVASSSHGSEQERPQA